MWIIVLLFEGSLIHVQLSNLPCVISETFSPDTACPGISPPDLLLAYPYKDISRSSLLKRAGCVAVDFGTDAGSPDMLASMKKSFTVEDVRRSSLACRNAGIDSCHSLIFGGPGETPETIRESVRLMDEISPMAVIAMTGIRIYRETEIERIAQKEGFISSDSSCCK